MEIPEAHEKDPAPKLEIESLIDRYAPTDEVFEVIAPLGDVFKFRPIPRYGALKDFRAAMFDWAAKIPLVGSSGAASHIWKDFLPLNASEAIAAYTIATLSVEPKFTHVDALRLLRAGNLVQHLMEGIERQSKTMESMWIGRLVEESKKNSEEVTCEG